MQLARVRGSYSCNYSCRSIKCTMMRHMMAGASVVLQLRTQFLRVLSRPIKTLKKPFESLQCAAEPRQGAFRRSYYYMLFIIYVIRCCVFPTSDLRRLSLFCISDKRRMLNGVPTQEPEIFRTRGQLSQNWQQCVRSIAKTAICLPGCSRLLA